MRPSLLILTAILAAGCSRNIDVDDTNGDDTSDTDTGGDTDTGDTDTGGDTGGGDTDAVDCQATYTTPAPGTDPGFDECVTEEIGCGDVIYATTTGGSTHYGDDWGVNSNKKWTDVVGCIGEDDLDDSYTPPERVYIFDRTQGHAGFAKVTLDDACGELSMRVLRSQECAGTNNASYACDASDTLANGDQVFQWINPGYSYAVIIDGRNGFTGNFRLEVECP